MGRVRGGFLEEVVAKCEPEFKVEAERMFLEEGGKRVQRPWV